MKIEHKLIIIIAVVILVIGLIGTIILAQTQSTDVISYYEGSAVTVAESLNQSLQQDMLANTRGHIQRTVQHMVARPLMNEVAIFDINQKVFASGDTSEIDQYRNDPKISLAIDTEATITRTEIRSGKEELCVIMPVLNAPECHACHNSSTQVLGAIEVGIDKGPFNAQLGDIRKDLAFVISFTFLAVGLALLIALRLLVTNPLSKLSKAAKQFASGDYRIRVFNKGTDEVSVVSRTFNQMAEQFEQYALTLEKSNKDMEATVTKRTQEVQYLATLRGQLLHRLISAQEEERRRIARELHDDVGQVISVLMLDLARVVDEMPAGATAVRERLSLSRDEASRALADLRRIIQALRPEVLDQLGLASALRSFSRGLLAGRQIQAQLKFSGLEKRLPPLLENTIFRITQEALSNVVRHSGASKVDVTIETNSQHVTVLVVDNGKGFDVDSAFAKSESWGLRGMRERITAIGGKLSIKSAPETGTTLQVEIPLEEII